ncbi:MAG TPA: lanthionine synthetase C family protein [Thermoanaerobaculia bacterium]
MADDSHLSHRSHRSHSSHRYSWSPLLTGTAAERALAVAHELADTLEDTPVTDAAISAGNAGIALFLAYAGRENAARQHLADAARVMASTVIGPSLYYGFPGIGWASLLLRRHGVITSDDAPFAKIDATLAAFLDRPHWPWHVDLVSGVAGLAVYALARLPDAQAERCLELIVRALEETSQETAEGIVWFTPPSLLTDEVLKKAPQGYFDYGVAHGLPGVIAALAGSVRAGVATGPAMRLLEGAVRTLRAVRLPSGNFPGLVGTGLDTRVARLAWCYGAPGIAVTLLRASEAAGREDWREEALDAGRWAARRSDEDSGVVDAGFCHGAAGVAHMFNVLYQATGEPLFAEAARHWLERTLDLRVAGRGLAGYGAFAPTAPAGSQWVAEPGMADGIAGIGATLVAATTHAPPEWDAMFLLR